MYPSIKAMFFRWKILRTYKGFDPILMTPHEHC